MAGHLAPPQGSHAVTGLLPEGDPAVLAAELEDAAAPLMLVGHLPHLARLTAALVGHPTVERIHFAPATAVGLRRDPDGWRLEWVIPSGTDGPR
jgi:phosphohistidine phosphatase